MGTLAVALVVLAACGYFLPALGLLHVGTLVVALVVLAAMLTYISVGREISIMEKHDHTPPPGDHKGPHHPTSAALAPTDRQALYLVSQLRLMPI